MRSNDPGDLEGQWRNKAYKAAGGFTEHPVISTLTGTLGAILLGFLVIAAIVIAGWQLNWWFKTQNVNREQHLIHHSFATQSTLRDQITSKIGDVQSISVQIAGAPKSQTGPLTAERYAVAQIVCQDAEGVTGDPLPTDEQQFVHLNCSNGNVNPTSTYAQGVNP